jgi:hypothetical protein
MRCEKLERETQSCFDSDKVLNFKKGELSEKIDLAEKTLEATKKMIGAKFALEVNIHRSAAFDCTPLTDSLVDAERAEQGTFRDDRCCQLFAA